MNGQPHGLHICNEAFTSSLSGKLPHLRPEEAVPQLSDSRDGADSRGKMISSMHIWSVSCGVCGLVSLLCTGTWGWRGGPRPPTTHAVNVTPRILVHVRYTNYSRVIGVSHVGFADCSTLYAWTSSDTSSTPGHMVPPLS